MSQTKVKSGLLNFPDQTDFIKLPSGTTAQRPSSPEEGYSRYNTTDDKLEYWNGTGWQQLPALDPPTLTSVDYPGNDLAADTAGGQTILINGTNFSAGISVEIGSTQVSSVTLNSTTQLAITSPALTAGDYDVTVTNLDATTITALDFISYNGVPSWVTASGSLGSLNFGEAISTITLSATEPDGGNVSYAITSGALPTGLSLSSSGDITGTMPSGSAETTYSFTVTATDDENQSTDRSFSITGVVPFINNQNFTTVTYTGNGGTQSITGVGFEPNLVWIKNRNTTTFYALVNSVVGENYIQYSNHPSAGEVNSNIVSSLDSDGFTVGIETTSNGNGQDLVAWCWRAGGAAVTNTDGTISAQVSANVDAGFSIVKQLSNGTNQTYGHGLGVAPSVIISKNLDVSGAWGVYHKDLGTGKWLFLNQTDAVGTSVNVYPIVNDTVFSGGSGGWNNLTYNYINYCFAEVEGFSNFGSYDGTGTGGHTIITGFEPAFVMMKAYNTGSSWFVVDNKRNLNNPRNSFLRIETTNAEVDAAAGVNFLGNGFEFTGQDFNDSGVSWIYMAFAENPNTQVPTKADSFNTVIYSGNGGTQTISGVGFETDLTITKTRVGVAYDHRVIDSVRGLKKDLYLNLTVIENHYSPDTYGYIQNISSTGYQVVDGTAPQDAYNESGVDYVSWNWKAGGTPYINTDGSITSVVSANKASGFSIVSYTGSGANATIGHGLGIAPSMIIVKGRNTTYDWVVYNSNLTATKYLTLNTGNAANSVSNVWNDTESTSTVFSVGSNLATNQSADPKIAYCFSEIPGFSKIGSFIGTRPSSKTITIGFEPAFLLIKNTSDPNEDWGIVDNKRFGASAPNKLLYASALNAEDDYTAISFTSTGFVVGDTGLANTNGSTIIYMAFANQF